MTVRKPTAADALRLLTTLDINKDGYVSRAEFVERMLEEGFKEVDVEELADLIDTNQDGTLYAKEITAGARPTTADAQKILDTMDINRDGSVSRAEFVERMLEEGFREADINALIELIDDKKDGAISAQEYVKLL